MVLPSSMFPSLSPSPLVFDAAACALLAAASALRARHASSPCAGACVLGFLCGVSAPLLRAVLMEQTSLVLDIPLYPAAALAGSLAGAFLGRFLWTEGQCFSLLDAAGMQLMACAGVLIARSWTHLSFLGVLLIAVVTVFLPGLIRDTALGDTAALADEPAYATAPLLGALLTVACLFLQYPSAAAVIVGWSSGFSVRAFVLLRTRR